ncbi:uncharacterized protein PRCAT00000557001 [Priceomyces carsonii]|uniref:uncharacterized protein n=1 Tax=Priceomyces carsonii TaxID=28549 RepID=UPI002ED77839|nr:unnamed protein product [Priceomyces carsonii]
MAETSPKGILRNRFETESENENHSDQFDRKEVIRNTRLNAQLASESSKGDEIRAKLAEAKSKLNGSDEHKDEEHLRWDELNLYKTEQEKCATMKIDEPKTPYEGGFNPEGEYYKDDDEIPLLKLGQGEFDENEIGLGESLNGGKIIKDPNFVDNSHEDKEDNSLTAEEKHKNFEEKRKEHYHMKGKALKHLVPLSDNEDNE